MADVLSGMAWKRTRISGGSRRSRRVGRIDTSQFSITITPPRPNGSNQQWLTRTKGGRRSKGGWRRETICKTCRCGRTGSAFASSRTPRRESVSWPTWTRAREGRPPTDSPRSVAVVVEPGRRGGSSRPPDDRTPGSEGLEARTRALVARFWLQARLDLGGVATLQQVGVAAQEIDPRDLPEQVFQIPFLPDACGLERPMQTVGKPNASAGHSSRAAGLSGQRFRRAVMGLEAHADSECAKSELDDIHSNDICQDNRLLNGFLSH
jgi:hypothetical protein